MGQLGRVTMLDESGYVILRVNGWRWIMHNCCVVPAPGEQPEDELSTAIIRTNGTDFWQANARVTRALRNAIPFRLFR